MNFSIDIVWITINMVVFTSFFFLIIILQGTASMLFSTTEWWFYSTRIKIIIFVVGSTSIESIWSIKVWVISFLISLLEVNLTTIIFFFWISSFSRTASHKTVCFTFLICRFTNILSISIAISKLLSFKIFNVQSITSSSNSRTFLISSLPTLFTWCCTVFVWLV